MLVNHQTGTSSSHSGFFSKSTVFFASAFYAISSLFSVTQAQDEVPANNDIKDPVDPLVQSALSESDLKLIQRIDSLLRSTGVQTQLPLHEQYNLVRKLGGLDFLPAQEAGEAPDDNTECALSMLEADLEVLKDQLTKIWSFREAKDREAFRESLDDPSIFSKNLSLLIDKLNSSQYFSERMQQAGIDFSLEAGSGFEALFGGNVAEVLNFLTEWHDEVLSATGGRSLSQFYFLITQAGFNPNQLEPLIGGKNDNFGELDQFLYLFSNNLEDSNVTNIIEAASKSTIRFKTEFDQISIDDFRALAQSLKELFDLNTSLSDSAVIYSSYYVYTELHSFQLLNAGVNSGDAKVNLAKAAEVKTAMSCLLHGEAIDIEGLKHLLIKRSHFDLDPKTSQIEPQFYAAVTLALARSKNSKQPEQALETRLIELPNSLRITQEKAEKAREKAALDQIKLFLKRLNVSDVEESILGLQKMINCVIQDAGFDELETIEESGKYSVETEQRIYEITNRVIALNKWGYTNLRSRIGSVILTYRNYKPKIASNKEDQAQ